MNGLAQDLRYALRKLLKDPAFTIVVVISLALGIGANTAIFSLINAVELEMLPVKNPRQLVLLSWASEGAPAGMTSLTGDSSIDNTGRMTSTGFSYPAFEKFRSHDQAFSNVFAFADLSRLNVSIDGQASLANGQMVSGNYFSGLGVAPVLGRAITTEDDTPGSDPVAVISHGYWKREFGAEPSAVGKTVALNQALFTIVGIAPPEFFGVEAGHTPDVWVPLSVQPRVAPDTTGPGTSLLASPHHWWISVIGRLRPGVSELEARAQLDAAFAPEVTSGSQPAKSDGRPTIVLTSANRGLDSLRQQFSRPLLILMVIVCLVLLIACANVAGLLVARATARQKEIGLRLAVGASKGRLIRQLLTESILLAAIGGACGLVFAYWGVRFLLTLMSSGRDPLMLNVHPNPTILAFTVLVSLLTGVLFGLLPAFHATRVDPAPVLKESSGTPSKFPGARLGVGNSLVTAQVAMSFLLIFGAGLFVHTLENLQSENLGFDRNNLLLFGVDPTQRGYDEKQLAAFYQQLQERIQVLPGVRAVSLSRLTLIGAGSDETGISVPGYTPRTGEKWIRVRRNFVGSDFLNTMGIKLLHGRDIDIQDTANSPKVAVVNETVARQFFGDQDPVGKRIGKPISETEETQIEIIGVARDAKYNDLRSQAPPTVYFPYAQWPAARGAMHFEVRTANDPLLLIRAIRSVAQETDKNLPLFDVRTQSEQIDQTLFQERLFASLSSVFGSLALLLASVGIYGLVGYSVVRRTREIGIRMALGARRPNILWIELRHPLLLVAFGTAIGLPVAFEVARLVSSHLFGVKSADPFTSAIAILVMFLAAGAAGYIPAHRAAKVDPMVALRYE